MENSLLTISVLIAIIVFVIAYALLVPKNTISFDTNTDRKDSDNSVLKFITGISNDIYAALPEGMVSKRKKDGSAKIQSLLIKSGNPWGVTVEEFVAFQYVSALLGFIAGWVIWFATREIVPLPWWITVLAVTVFSFFIPRIKYRDAAKQRDIEFKRELPDALDLLIISLSGGMTFGQALRAVVPNMNDSILKDEFKNILKNIDAGETMDEALEKFYNRAPNESVGTFIRSIQTSIQLNTPLVETLSSRAKASREEFFAMIHQKTAQLESKMWMILAPTMLPAVAIVAVAPSVASMMESLG